jgi:hypothetical protein
MLVAFMRTLASGCFSTLNEIALIVRMWGAAQSASDAGVMSGTGALAFFSQVRLLGGISGSGSDPHCGSVLTCLGLPHENGG